MKKETEKYTLEDFIKKCEFEDTFRKLEKTKKEEYHDMFCKAFEELEDYVGREVEKDEAYAVFNLIEEIMPKDGNGKYLINELPDLIWVWKIYEAKRKIILKRFQQLLELEQKI